MAKKEKKNTIMSQLNELDRETAQELQQEPVAPVATTNYTQVPGIVQPGASFQAAYNAQRDLIDQSVANGPLFGGQTGAVGEAAKDRAMAQGLNPAMEAPVQGSLYPNVETQTVAPVEPVNPVGAKVRERALENGLYGSDTGQVGELAAKRAQQEGLYPDVAAQNYSQEPKAGGWTQLQEDILAPYKQRLNELEGERQEVLDLDAELQRKEDARKRIVALGDAFASFANLIGTAHGAENQKQTYASPLVADSIEGSRKLRAARMQQIRKNIDEQRDMLNALQLKNDPNYLPNKMEQQRIDNTAAQRQLQYDKLAQTIEHQGNQDALNTRKQDWKEQTDAAKQAADERKQDFNEWKGKQQVAQGWSRINLSNQKFAEQLARNGGGGSSKNWSDEALEDYNAFKNEVAHNAGYDTWQQFSEAAKTDSDMREFVNNVNNANTPNNQRGVLNNYAKDYAPEYYNRYHQGSAKASGGKGKQRLYDYDNELEGF